LFRRTALLAVGVALALPSVAAASSVSLSPPVSCLQPGKMYTVAGTGFSPNIGVHLSGENVSDTFQTNSAGTFTNEDATGIVGPEYTSFTPKMYTVTATDPVKPANNTSFSFEEALFGSNVPVSGKASQVVTWEFAGFLNNAPIYGHYLYQRKLMRTVSFGNGAGNCGALVTKAKRFPIKNPKKFGTWEIRVDSNAQYNPNAEPLAEASFDVPKTKTKHKKRHHHH
jgi:hypothetical protein